MAEPGSLDIVTAWQQMRGVVNAITEKRWCAKLILRGVGRSRISCLIVNPVAVHRKR